MKKIILIALLLISCAASAQITLAGLQTINTASRNQLAGNGLQVTDSLVVDGVTVLNALRGFGTGVVGINNIGQLSWTTAVSPPIYDVNEIVYGDGVTAGGTTTQNFIFNPTDSSISIGNAKLKNISTGTYLSSAGINKIIINRKPSIVNGRIVVGDLNGTHVIIDSVNKIVYAANPGDGFYDMADSTIIQEFNGLGHSGVLGFDENGRLVEAATVSDSAWSLNGNSITGNKVLGTTNNRSFVQVVNSIERLKQDTLGSMIVSNGTDTLIYTNVDDGGGATSDIYGSYKALSGRADGITGIYHQPSFSDPNFSIMAHYSGVTPPGGEPAYHIQRNITDGTSIKSCIGDCDFYPVFTGTKIETSTQLRAIYLLSDTISGLNLLMQGLGGVVSIDNNAHDALFGINNSTPTVELDVTGDGHITGDLIVDGKITGTGGIDPPYISFSSETHKATILKSKNLKKDQDVMQFYCKDHDRFEVYNVRKGKFFTLTGEIVK